MKGRRKGVRRKLAAAESDIVRKEIVSAHGDLAFSEELVTAHALWHFNEYCKGEEDESARAGNIPWECSRAIDPRLIEQEREDCYRRILELGTRVCDLDAEFFERLANAIRLVRSKEPIDKAGSNLLGAIRFAATRKPPGEGVRLRDIMETLEEFYPNPHGYDDANLRKLARELDVKLTLSPKETDQLRYGRSI